jgi:hypothetical protein
MSNCVCTCKDCGSQNIKLSEPTDECSCCGKEVILSDLKGQFESASICKSCFEKHKAGAFLYVVVDGEEFFLPVSSSPMENAAGGDVEVVDWILQYSK